MDRVASNPPRAGALEISACRVVHPRVLLAMQTHNLAPKAGVTTEMHAHAETWGERKAPKGTCQLLPYLVLAAPGPE